jgi:hypothetical protein
MSVIKECIRRFREEVPRSKETRSLLNEESFWWIRSSSEQESRQQIETRNSLDSASNSTEDKVRVVHDSIYSDDIIDQSSNSDSEEPSEYDEVIDKSRNDDNYIEDVYLKYDDYDFDHLENSNLFHLKPANLTIFDDNFILDHLDEYASDLLLQCDQFLAVNMNDNSEENGIICFSSERNIVNSADKGIVISSLVDSNISTIEVGTTDKKNIELQEQYLSKEVQTESCNDADICKVDEILEMKHSIDILPVQSRVKSGCKTIGINNSIESNDIFYLSSVENSLETLSNIFQPNIDVLKESNQSLKSNNINLLIDETIPLNIDISSTSKLVVSNESTLKEPLHVDNAVGTISNCDHINICNMNDTKIITPDNKYVIESGCTKLSDFVSHVKPIIDTQIDIIPTLVEVIDDSAYIDPLTGIDLHEFLVNPAISNLWHKVINKK